MVACCQRNDIPSHNDLIQAEFIFNLLIFDHNQMMHTMTWRVINGILMAMCLNLPLMAGFFEPADQFFKTYVEDGLVKYEELHRNLAALDSLVEEIAAFEISTVREATQKAFYINAYNVLMIHTVVEHYPVGSPLDIDGVFDSIRHVVGGQRMTLDDIEKEVLLKKFFDPRLHFVLVCGAMDCPPLASFAYMPAKLEVQLERQTYIAINSPDFIRVNEEENHVALSMILEWYREDFLREHESILAYVNTYRTNRIPARFQLDHYAYDWSLNEWVP
jgi:hypothetical protein